MKISKNRLREIVKEVIKEESEYQTFFKKALEKAGKSIPQMSDEEKKEFFNKIDAAWKAKGEKNEELTGNQHKLDVDGDGEIESSDLAALRAKKDESVNENKISIDKKVTNIINTSDFKKFVRYINSFYGKKGVYSSGKDVKEKDIIKALYNVFKRNNSYEWGDGDSVDREFVRDELMKMGILSDKMYEQKVNEAIKVGSSVIVNYPTLKKPIKGKVKHILNSPQGLVYVLDGDKGVWDAKYLSTNESVVSEGQLKKFDDVHIKSKNLSGMVYKISGNTVVVRTIDGLVKAKKDDVTKIHSDNVNEGLSPDIAKHMVGIHKGFVKVEGDGTMIYDSPAAAKKAADFLNSKKVAASSDGKYLYIESVNEDLGTIALGVIGGIGLYKILKFALKKVGVAVGSRVSLPKESLHKIVEQTHQALIKNFIKGDKTLNMMEIATLSKILKDYVDDGNIKNAKDIQTYSKRAIEAILKNRK